VSDADLVERARRGDREALGSVLESLRTPLHRLATSMFWDREDAEDATQEALIAVMTNLAGFRGESTLSTWAYRIAVRLYLRRRQSHTERSGVTFDSFAADLLDGLAATDSTRPDAELLAEELRIGCTLAVLQCLDRDERLVFILGDVLALPGEEAAQIVGTTHDVYRKRLSRVRRRIREFVSGHCGVVNPSAPCRCRRRIDVAVGGGRMQPERLRFVERSMVEDAKLQIQELHDVAALFRSAGAFDSPADLTTQVLRVLDTNPGPLFD
jgi:RNA polymerase sigma factor (sigma-70 family)